MRQNENTLQEKSMKAELDEMQALVLGGTSSVGLEVARHLKTLGCQVTVIGRHRTDDFKTFVTDFEMQLTEKRLPEIPIDMKDAVQECQILCLCYGPFVQKTLEETLESDWQKVALLDYALPGMLTSLAIPNMIRKGFGRIIFFGGTRTDQIRSFRTNAAYAGAKTGLDVLVKSISENYGQFGITANAIMPGFTRNAPENAELVSERELAEKAMEFVCGDSSGNLVRVDKGWEPATTRS